MRISLSFSLKANFSLATSINCFREDVVTLLRLPHSVWKKISPLPLQSTVSGKMLWLFLGYHNQFVLLIESIFPLPLQLTVSGKMSWLILGYHNHVVSGKKSGHFLGYHKQGCVLFKWLKVVFILNLRLIFLYENQFNQLFQRLCHITPILTYFSKFITQYGSEVHGYNLWKELNSEISNYF